jgi:hypothetical protein
MLCRAARLDHHYLRVQRLINFDFRKSSIRELPFKDNSTGKGRNNTIGRHHSAIQERVSQPYGRFQKLTRRYVGAQAVPVDAEMLKTDDFLNGRFPGSSRFYRCFRRLAGRSLCNAVDMARFPKPVLFRDGTIQKCHGTLQQESTIIPNQPSKGDRSLVGNKRCYPPRLTNPSSFCPDMRWAASWGQA